MRGDPSKNSFDSVSRGRLFDAQATPRPTPRLPVIIVALLLGGVPGLTGCHAPAQPAGPTYIVLDVPDYDAFVDASLSVLRRYDFPPDRVERERGLIITHPATSGQWFEPWRADARGGYQLLESSLHTMRRVVTVNIEPLEAGQAAATDEEPLTTQPESARAGRYRMQVRVDKSRYSAPERQVTTASGALAIYSERLPTTEGLRGAQSRGAHWVPLGRDPLLESFLLDRLTDAVPSVFVAAD